MNKPSFIHSVPAHVPAELVQDFDFFTNPDMNVCPFHTTARLLEGPRIFYNPNMPRWGTWVPTRAEDIRYIVSHPELFSNKEEAGFSMLFGENWPLIPLELDPPDHTQYRKLLNPLMSPGVVNRMTEGLTERAVELIEAVREQGGCEFIGDFARRFPIEIFMQLMGLPLELSEQFLEWEWMLLHAPEMETKIAGAAAIRNYLQELADLRRADPKDDLTSIVVAAEVDGRKLTDDEVMGVLYLLFVGGLDTVTSTLGFFFKHLAENPEDQQRLREKPELIPSAMEEMLRRYSVVISYRMCITDVEVGGVQMKAGDWITISYALGNLDPEEFACPMSVDIERPRNRHMGFSFGPHFCMGNHLARRELQVALREWLARVPPFTVKPGSEVKVHGGAIYGVDHLELVW